MPYYDYKCKSCGHTEEIHQSIKEEPVRECTNCKKKTFERVIRPATVQFKGTGFHVTDYKKR